MRGGHQARPLKAWTSPLSMDRPQEAWSRDLTSPKSINAVYSGFRQNQISHEMGIIIKKKTAIFF